MRLAEALEKERALRQVEIAREVEVRKIDVERAREQARRETLQVL